MVDGRQSMPEEGPAADIAGAIAHDFNNLLTVILGCSETLMTELGDPRQRRLAALIVQAAERGANATRALLEIDMSDAPVASSGPMAGGNENILVVEDNDLVREHVREKLESLGYQVALATNGAEAIATLEQRGDIDLLFTDVLMPGGMNGRQLGEAAAGRWPSLRLLYTSGYSADVLRDDSGPLTAINLLSKPYTKSQLAAKIRAALDMIP